MQISNRVEKIFDLLSDNQLMLKDLSDINQDMKDYLDTKSCLYYQNCKNVIININNKINKIILSDCHNITLTVGGLISGIEIKRCTNIFIKTIKKESLNCVVIDRSNDISVKLPKKFSTHTIFEIIHSNSIKVTDLSNKIINYKSLSYC